MTRTSPDPLLDLVGHDEVADATDSSGSTDIAFDLGGAPLRVGVPTVREPVAPTTPEEAPEAPASTARAEAPERLPPPTPKAPTSEPSSETSDSPDEDDAPGPPVEEGAPAWVMTFGDLMSLLLTFFILLFSMSSIEEEAFKAVADSMVEAFGGEGNPITSPADDPVGGPPPPVPLPVGQVAEEMLQELAQRFASAAAGEVEISVEVGDQGLFVRIPSASLFQPGSATLETQGRSAITNLADVVAQFGFPVIVSGHTDDVPIASEFFPSNWELSGARAAGVARLLLEGGVSTELVRVRAFGEHQPLAANDNPEGRARNRRVELFYPRSDLEAGLSEAEVSTPGASTAGDAAGSPTTPSRSEGPNP